MKPCIVAKAPSDASYFFGFHDLIPWSPDNSKVLLHRVDPNIRELPCPDHIAEIVLWSPASTTVEVIGETTTWNFQQGARAMWVPGQGNTVLFNRRIGDAPGAEIVNLDTGERRTIAHAVGDISPDGSYAYAPNFARLGLLWPAYGYSGFNDPTVNEPLPSNDGLWRIDMETGERELAFSIKELAAASGGSIAEGVKAFVTHVSFNPEGTRIVFMLRFFSKDYALYSLIYSANADGTELTFLAQEKISHFDWVAEDKIVIWMRRAAKGLAAARKSGLLASPFVRPLVNVARKFKGKLKGKMLNESYFLLSTNGGEPIPFMRGTLAADGHPMMSQDRKWMIVDEYPHSNGDTPLMLVKMESQTRTDLVTFKHDVGSDNSDLKCDLHPRWDRSGTRVGVDASENGRRQFTIVDVSDLIQEDE